MTTQFKLLGAAVLAAMTIHQPLWAADGTNASVSATTAQTPSEQATGMSEGEIRKVDKGAGKLTIKHGPLVNLDMPAMTMVFQVKDPKMLNQVEPGDKVNFVANKVGGKFTVTKIEVKK
jgi:Cu(I)/Ag(I) efflux system protein CusF